MAYRTEIIDIRSSEYPEKLRQIPDPPERLYCTGDTSLLHERSIAVVGARKYTVYGKSVALMTGRIIAEAGIPIVSGLALGIDGFAHEGALEADGRVIGVLGSGINMMSPERNKPLMKRGIESGGLVVSEYEPDEPASPWTFPARNRIISGLAEAVVVVEAGLNSGSLITAKHAAEQGRSVYAVPGNINSRSSIGSNLLIRDGATPLVIIDDLIRDSGIEVKGRGTERSELDSDEQKIFDAVMHAGGATTDEIVRATGLDAGMAGSLLTVMQIKGIVESYAGRIYISR